MKLSKERKALTSIKSTYTTIFKGAQKYIVQSWTDRAKDHWGKLLEEVVCVQNVETIKGKYDNVKKGTPQKKLESVLQVRKKTHTPPPHDSDDLPTYLPALVPLV